MDRQPGPALAVVDAAGGGPRRRSRRRRRASRGRGRGAQPDEGVPPGIALAVPGPPPTDGDLDLDHRLEPVDVRSFEQADLDQSHGPRQDSKPAAGARRLGGRCDRRRMTRDGPTDPELDALRGRRSPPTCPAYLGDLEQLVNIDCGSYTPDGVDEVGRWTAGFLTELGADVDIRPDPEGRFGNTVVGTFDGRAERPARPADRAHGHRVRPGDRGRAPVPHRRRDRPRPRRHRHEVRAARRAVRAQGAHRRGSAALPFERLTFIANPDEEIGSPTSTPHIRAAAADVDACLVLECARANGDIVSARKGILDTRLTVHGRAAHAGVEPEKGRNAILEAARIVRDLHALNGRWPGVTVNVGKIAGGTRPNVVAERCDLEVDVRATTARRARGGRGGGPRGRRRDRGRRTRPSSAHVMVAWRPMEKLERSGRLVEHAQAVAERLGFEVHDTATGGASDANTTPGMGVPTLDGLGPDRRQRPLAGGVPRGRLDRAPDDACWPALLLAIARDPEVLRVAGRRPAASRRRLTGDGRPTADLVGRAVGGASRATAGRSWSATRAGWPARPTPARTARRSTRVTSPARRGRVFAIIERALAEARVRARGRRADADVHHGHRRCRRPSRRSTARSSGRSARPRRSVVVAGSIDPSLLVEIEADARRGLIGRRGQAGIAARPVARAHGHERHRRDEPEQQVLAPRRDAMQTRTASHSIPTWNDGVPGVVGRRP